MAEPITTSRLMVLMFTDVIGSVGLKHKLGMGRYTELIGRHDQLFQQIIGEESGARLLKDTGDGFLASFPTPSHAVEAALRFQYVLSQQDWGPHPVRVRIGLHQGEVTELDQDTFGQIKIVGLAADISARIMEAAGPAQILITRAIFDDARQYLREHPRVDLLPPPPSLQWMAHGPYLFQGHEELIEVFEVGAVGIAPLEAPADSKKARRAVTLTDEEALGWRPAVELEIPHRPGWILERQLGKGGFGEVWLGKQNQTSERRVFKFCFDSERRRSLRREVRLMRLIRDELGERADIARLHDMQLEEAPFFLEMEYTEEGSLPDWAMRNGGAGFMPLSARIDLMARVCEAVAAAHSVGILHKDIKPSNILIYRAEDGTPRPRLADFGIGILTEIPDGDYAMTTGTGVTAPIMTNMHEAGTRLYLPPETLVGQLFTEQGDVYALGVVLFQLVVADFRRPLGMGWERQVTDPVLRELIAECVDVDIDQRLKSATELAHKLRNLDARRKELEFLDSSQAETRRRVHEEQQRRHAHQRKLLLVNIIGLGLLVIVLAWNMIGSDANNNAEQLPDLVDSGSPDAAASDANLADASGGQGPADSGATPTEQPTQNGSAQPGSIAAAVPVNNTGFAADERALRNTIAGSSDPRDRRTSLDQSLTQTETARPESAEANEMARLVTAYIYRRDLDAANDQLLKLRVRHPQSKAGEELQWRLENLQKQRDALVRAAADAIDDRNLSIARSSVHKLGETFPNDPELPKLSAKLAGVVASHDRLVRPIELALQNRDLRLAQAGLDTLLSQFTTSDRAEELQGLIDAMRLEVTQLAAEVAAALNRDDARSAKYALGILSSRYPHHDRLPELTKKVDALTSAVDSLLNPVTDALDRKDPLAAEAALAKFSEVFKNDRRLRDLTVQVQRQVSESSDVVDQAKLALDDDNLYQAQSSIEDLRARFPSDSRLTTLQQSLREKLDSAAMSKLESALRSQDQAAARAAMNELERSVEGGSAVLRSVLLGLAHDRRGTKEPGELRLAMGALDQMLQLNASPAQVRQVQQIREQLRDSVALPLEYSSADVIETPEQLSVLAMSFLPEPGRFIAVSQDGSLRQFDAKTMTEAGEPMQLDIDRLLAAAITRRGDRVVVTDGDQLALYERDGASYVKRHLPGRSSSVSELAVGSGDGDLLVGWAPSDPSVRIWNMAERSYIGTIAVDNEPTAAAISPVGRVVAVGDRIGEILLFSSKDGVRIGSYQNGNVPIESIVFSHDGSELAVGYRNGLVDRLNLNNGQWSKPLGKVAWQRIDAMAYRFDGRLIWSSDVGDGFLKVCPPDAGEAAAWTTLSPVKSFAVSPDGWWIATWSGSERLKVFGIKDMQSAGR